MTNIILQLNQEKANSDPELLTQIGHACEEGTVFQKDYSAALSLYTAAANAGDAQAINNIGWMYQNGMGVEKNVETAIEHYLKAADAGNARAQINLGNIAIYKHLGVKTKSCQKHQHLFISSILGFIKNNKCFI